MSILRQALPALTAAFTLTTALPGTATAATTAAALQAAGAHVDASGRLQVDVHFDCALAPPVTALTAAGLAVTSSVKAGTLCVVEGWVPSADLAPVAGVDGVLDITAPSYLLPTPPHPLGPASRTLERAQVARQGSTTPIDQNGISIMHAGAFITQTRVTGTGVTVGVQSSGICSLAAIQKLGELPASVQVLYPSGTTPNTCPAAADEGTILLEEIHAVAPGASLVYCGPNTFVDFTSCMSQLMAAGATILLDDTAFPSDGLMSQNNDQSTAISTLLSQNPNVLMFSSAGNNDGTYWEGDYAPVSSTSFGALSCQSGPSDNYVATFGSGVTSQTLTVSGTGASFPLLLAWSDPPSQITSRFDVYWFAAGSTTPAGCFTTAGSTTPDQAMDYVSLAGGTYTLVVATPDASASGEFLKLWAGGDGLTALSVSTSGGLVSPQAMVPTLLTIGAVNGSDGIGNTVEPFSSSGPLTVQFPAFAQLQAPTLMAPDGISVDASGTYFAADLFPDGNFYGTSASVANAGAVAALLRSAFPSLNVAQVTTALETGATVLAQPVPNDTSGYGRVDALGALNTIPIPTASALVDESSVGSKSTASQSFTISGTGTLTFSVSSSNPALVPNAIVGAGTAGVTLSSGCGTTTLNCTLLVTPVAGQAGTAIVTISVLDGANRAGQTHLTVDATDPAPAASNSAGNSGSMAASTGSHGGGGAMQLWMLLALGGLVARRAKYSHESADCSWRR
ncbi:MAG TPA: S8 family serine peptidase [Steroidobacteraceae bacterium]|nr:S8 family serine peptidase [Steroidobacteraceae bacterium]